MKSSPCINVITSAETNIYFIEKLVRKLKGQDERHVIRLLYVGWNKAVTAAGRRISENFRFFFSEDWITTRSPRGGLIIIFYSNVLPFPSETIFEIEKFSLRGRFSVHKAMSVRTKIFISMVYIYQGRTITRGSGLKHFVLCSFIELPASRYSQ